MQCPILSHRVMLVLIILLLPIWGKCDRRRNFNKTNKTNIKKSSHFKAYNLKNYSLASLLFTNYVVNSSGIFNYDVKLTSYKNETTLDSILRRTLFTGKYLRNTTTALKYYEIFI